MTLEPGFAPGDAVGILAGSFRGFIGVVIGAGADRLKVAVPVFGRRTLLDLDHGQVSGAR